MPLSLVGRDARVSFYAAQVARFGVPVLVLGSADGALARALGSRGHSVVGVEPSALLHEEAEQETTSTSVTLLHADLRALRLSQQFPLVLAPRNTLALAAGPEDLDALLATVRSHLTATGTLVFDVEGQLELPGVEGPMGRSLFPAHLRERTAGPVRRMRRSSLPLHELELALNTAGLEPTERYGDFTGRPWDDTDQLQVVVAGVRC